MLLQDYITNELKLQNLYIDNALFDEKENHLDIKFKYTSPIDINDKFINDFKSKILTFININDLKSTCIYSILFINCFISEINTFLCKIFF